MPPEGHGCPRSRVVRAGEQNEMSTDFSGTGEGALHLGHCFICLQKLVG